MTNKAEARLVFVPCPGMGHLVSAVEFAKLLFDRDDRLCITVLVINSPSDTKTRSYTQSLASSSFSERAQLIILPEPHIPTSAQANPGSYMNALREFGVPALLFFKSGLGLMLHLHTLRERDNVDTTELKGTDTELAIPSFANPVPAKVLPSIVLNKEWDHFFLDYARGLKKADGIIVNSFEELESYAVHSFSRADIPIYPVGPILNIKLKGDDKGDIIKWLDDQPPSSVIFLCFGSKGNLDEDQVREIARALEDCGTRFLWSLRKPPPKDFMGTPSDYTPQELAEVLPEGFLDRTAEIGKVIGVGPAGPSAGPSGHRRICFALRVEFHFGEHLLWCAHCHVAALCRTADQWLLNLFVS